MTRIRAPAGLGEYSMRMTPVMRTGMPASSSRTETGTPVHCAQDNRPWVCCTVFDAGFSQSVRPLPEHSMK